MSRATLTLRLAALGIVTVLWGCDNVDWGGAEIAIVPPPPKASDDQEVGDRPEEERLPEGPVLYYVTPGVGGATMLPVAEISGDSLRPIRPAADWQTYGRRFIAEHLREGAEFTLYRGGARVGTLVLRSAGMSGAAVCPRVPTATGVLELVTGAERAPEFLAIGQPQASGASGRAFLPREPTPRVQFIAPILAEQLLRARGAPLPNNWGLAMAQLTPFPLEGTPDPAFAATLLVGDTLGTGLDNQGYSLFFIGRPAAQAGYDTVYADFADYPRTGKAARRVIDHLDWDRDGQPELLLEVYGTTGRWFEAVGRGSSGWRKTLNTRCETPPPAATPATVPDTTTSPATPGSAGPQQRPGGPEGAGQ